MFEQRSDGLVGLEESGLGPVPGGNRPLESIGILTDDDRLVRNGHDRCILDTVGNFDRFILVVFADCPGLLVGDTERLICWLGQPVVQLVGRERSLGDDCPVNNSEFVHRRVRRCVGGGRLCEPGIQKREPTQANDYAADNKRIQQ